MDLQMNGKTALVTRASAGIGRAIAFALAREGVDVAICARRKEPLEATASQIGRETNRKIVAIPADLTKPALSHFRGPAQRDTSINGFLARLDSRQGNLRRAHRSSATVTAYRTPRDERYNNRRRGRPCN